MHARKADRHLTKKRAGAKALARALLLVTAAGCHRLQGEAVLLRPHELIVGRASMGVSKVVLLTDAPALVSIDLERRTSHRREVARDAVSRKLWGLGEIDGALYSIEGFMELVRLSPDGTRARAAAFAKPMGNLFDTADGMAGQIAIDDVAMPLAWAVDRVGGLEALAGARRKGLGMSRAEEGALHLLACSVPPRVICWLPGSSQLFVLQDGRLDARLELEGVAPLLPARMLERPESRVIQDALRTEHGTIVAAVRDVAEKPGTTLAEYGADGRFIRRLPAPASLRLVLGSRAGIVFGMTTSGRLVGVQR